jgi:signal-transduction protein with cAMP-binding, CBS, and nucleotidyltransferase domain
MHRRKEMVLFKGLSEPNMQAMIKRMKVKSFKDGEKIVEQGTIGTTMYFIDLGGARAIVGETVAQTLASGMRVFVCVFACAGGGDRVQAWHVCWLSRPAHGESSKKLRIPLSSHLLENLSKDSTSFSTFMSRLLMFARVRCP